MDFIKFFDNRAILNEKAFKDLEANFSKHLNAFNFSKYGLVKEGLNITLENNRVIVSEGIAIFPNGTIIQHKTSIPTPYYNRNIFLFFRDDRYRVLETLEKSTIPENPYSDTYFSTDNILAIGFIENGKAYEMNRVHQIPNFPINGIGLWNGEFRNYTTLRGCRIAEKEKMLDKLLRVDDKNVKGIGGESSLKLEKKHIPTLTLNGTLEEAGKHYHKYLDGTNKGDNNRDDYGESYDDFYRRYWNGRIKAWTGWAGEHSHKIVVRHKNDNQEELSLEPDYITLIPIIREF